MADIRVATEADCEAIYRVQIAAVRSLPNSVESRAGIEKWLAGQEPSVYARSMAEETFIVAELENEVVAWGSLNVPKQEITNIFVDPDYQRQHIGSEIISRLEALAVESQIDVVQLQAAGSAIEFYVNKGYRSDPPVPAGADWALMKKRLT